MTAMASACATNGARGFTCMVIMAQGPSPAVLIGVRRTRVGGIRYIRARSFLSIRSHTLAQYCIRSIRVRSFLSIRYRPRAHIHASPAPATHVLFFMVPVRIHKDRIRILRLGASAPGRVFVSRNNRSERQLPAQRNDVRATTDRNALRLLDPLPSSVSLNANPAEGMRCASALRRKSRITNTA
jgi:hypothetical protein